MMPRRFIRLFCCCTEEQNKSNSNGKKPSAYKGLVLAMLSAVFFSIAAIIVKKVSNLKPEQLAVYRFVAITVFSLPDAVKSEESLLGPQGFRYLLILRGLFGATNILLSFFAFRYLPLGDASVIIFSAPVFVTIAARIFLKEQCGYFQSIAVAFTIIGIILTTVNPLQQSAISRQYSAQTIIGFFAAAGSVFFNTCRYIVMRKLKTVNTSLILFTSGWISVIETAVLTAIFGTFKWHNCGLDQLYMILLGLVSYLGQMLLTMALQCEQAGPVCTMRAAIDIILGFAWQIIFFADIPDIYSVFGAILVITSASSLALRKWVSTLPRESPYFKRLRWLSL